MGQDSQRPPQWRDRIRQGTEAFRNARLWEAISAFQSASDSNPTSPIPHLYLAVAFLQQSYAPNVAGGDNVDPGRLAEAALHRALEFDPTNWTAIVLLGSSASNHGRVDEAREWYRKAVALEPRNADAWATLGAIDFRRSVQNGWRENEIEESIRDFEKSIALNPAHETSMEYLSFLLRRRASIKPDGDAARRDLTAADNWEERASDARAEKLQAQVVHPVRRSPGVDDSGRAFERTGDVRGPAATSTGTSSSAAPDGFWACVRRRRDNSLRTNCTRSRSNSARTCSPRPAGAETHREGRGAVAARRPAREAATLCCRDRQGWPDCERNPDWRKSLDEGDCGCSAATLGLSNDDDRRKAG